VSERAHTVQCLTLFDFALLIELLINNGCQNLGQSQLLLLGLDSDPMLGLTYVHHFHSKWYTCGVSRCGVSVQLPFGKRNASWITRYLRPRRG
jgi:hypothetical protein